MFLHLLAYINLARWGVDPWDHHLIRPDQSDPTIAMTWTHNPDGGILRIFVYGVNPTKEAGGWGFGPGHRP